MKVQVCPYAEGKVHATLTGGFKGYAPSPACVALRAKKSLRANEHKRREFYEDARRTYTERGKSNTQDGNGRTGLWSSSCGSLATGSIARRASIAVAFEHNVGGLHVIHRVNVEDRVALLKVSGQAGTKHGQENCIFPAMVMPDIPECDAVGVPEKRRSD